MIVFIFQFSSSSRHCRRRRHRRAAFVIFLFSVRCWLCFFFCWFLHSLCSWAVLFYGNDSSYRIKTQRIQWNSEQNAQINAFIEMRSIFAFSQMIIGLLLFDQFLFLLGSCCSSLYVIISLCAQQIQWDVLHGIYFSKLNICQLNNVILVTDSCWDKNMVMI